MRVAASTMNAEEEKKEKPKGDEEGTEKDKKENVEEKEAEMEDNEDFGLYISMSFDSIDDDLTSHV